jgi:predicted dehydrogenase
MSTASIQKLGRRLRLGLVGGAGGALIGPVHRLAARLDDCFELTAGVLSSDPARSKAEAARLNIARGYADMAAMIAGEAARADGIDAVAIMTPNDSHARYVEMALNAGLDVICDKPLTNDYASSKALAVLARSKGLVLAVTYNYSGYPMLREARAAIAAGEIGKPQTLHAAYVSGSLGTLVEAEPEKMSSRTRWRLDSARGGLSHVLADIGTHAHQLVNYVAGQRIEAVLADVGAAVPGRTAHDTASVIVRLEGGARGPLFITKAATGAENAMSIEVYGQAGGLYWHHAAANELRVMRHARPAEIRTRGLPTLHPLARAAARLPAGHPEGFHEGFANLYRDFAELAASRRANTTPDPLATSLPTGEDGAQGLAFCEACVASAESGKWVTLAQP